MKIGMLTWLLWTVLVVLVFHLVGWL